MGAWLIVWRGRLLLRETTLMTAWSWGFVASTAWVVMWWVDCCLHAISPAVADHGWYGCAVLALCPPIAVLGSRRPGTRVWSWFILVPMVLALSWPILALRLRGAELRGLQLEAPQLMALILVLVMGIGNYLGTRYTISAMFFAAAQLSIIFSFFIASPEGRTDRSLIRFGSTAIMALAILSTRNSKRPGPRTRFDRVWFDFFDTFGIVWGRRIQDRVNVIAQKENWPIRLELDGFVANEGTASAAVDSLTCDPLNASLMQPAIGLTAGEELVATRIDHTLRWLLRRFVDAGWIDQRLESTRSPEPKRLTIDS